MAADLKARFQVEPELVKGSGGVFEVIVDGTPLFSKRALGRFPEDGEVVRLVAARETS